MKRILFVDDEPHVLAGLKRMLGDFAEQWEMEFAQSGAAALEILTGKPFDVIVTDMRMPGMTGAQLLAVVKSRFPDMTRICLSGQSNQESAMRVVGLAHQFLSKPCEPETLEATIVRACALRDHLSDPMLRKTLTSLEAVPALPENYHAVVAELNRSEPSLADFGKLIARDMAMTAKILQLVNSSFFGLGRRLTSAEEAVSLLGLTVVHALVLSTGLFSHLGQQICDDSLEDELMTHGIAVASAAKAIAAMETTDRDFINDTFVAGLMHDIGKLILAAALRQDYVAAMTAGEAAGLSDNTIELQQFGLNHADVGAYLMDLWGLPAALIEAIAFHHVPESAMSTGFTPLTAVHVANALVHERDCPNAKHGPTIHFGYLNKLRLLNRLTTWRETVRNLETKQAGVMV